MQMIPRNGSADRQKKTKKKQYIRNGPHSEKKREAFFGVCFQRARKKANSERQRNERCGRTKHLTGAD